MSASVATLTISRMTTSFRNARQPSPRRPTTRRLALRITVSLARFRCLNRDLGAVTHLVGAPADNRVALFQRAEHLDQVPNPRATADVDPLRHTVVDPNHEGPLRRGHNA